MRRFFNIPSWGLSSPFDELERMKAQMERLSQGFFRKPESGVFPLVNVTEDKDNYFVRAELPGLKTENLDITVTGNNLAISGQRNIPEESKDAKYHRRERESGKFSRIISLPNQIDGEKIEARLTDGVLTVILPKLEASKPRQIHIKN